jgi:hypothetical protein
LKKNWVKIFKWVSCEFWNVRAKSLEKQLLRIQKQKLDKWLSITSASISNLFILEVKYLPKSKFRKKHTISVIGSYKKTTCRFEKLRKYDFLLLILTKQGDWFCSNFSAEPARLSFLLSLNVGIICQNMVKEYEQHYTTTIFFECW